MKTWIVAFIAATVPGVLAADPAMECGLEFGSQVEIADCVAKIEARVDQSVDLALGFARNNAAELDQVTGRVVAVPALDAAQAAWLAYRDAQCDFVGAMFGGGSGTGIGIRSCRIDLGRERVRELMAQAG